MTESPLEKFLREHPTGATVEGEVVRIIPAGAFLSLLPAGMPGKLEGFLPISQMATERVEKPEHVVKVGEKVECKIVKVEKAGSRISLSRKALIQHQEREAIRQYGGDPGSQKGGMKLGELLQGIRVEGEHKPKPVPVPVREPEHQPEPEPVREPAPEPEPVREPALAPESEPTMPEPEHPAEGQPEENKPE
jgi:predicted RNA-binding protein with RPS1 domain